MISQKKTQKIGFRNSLGKKKKSSQKKNSEHSYTTKIVGKTG